MDNNQEYNSIDDFIYNSKKLAGFYEIQHRLFIEHGDDITVCVNGEPVELDKFSIRRI